MEVTFHGYTVMASSMRVAQMVLAQAERELKDGDIDNWFYARCPIGNAHRAWAGGAASWRMANGDTGRK